MPFTSFPSMSISTYLGPTFTKTALKLLGLKMSLKSSQNYIHKRVIECFLTPSH
jgi:hypothetical protein